MAMERDPIRDYNRKLDLIFQEMQDRKDRELFERVKKAAYCSSEKAVRSFIEGFRESEPEEGLTIAQARAEGDELLEWVLDNDRLDPYLKIKPDGKNT
jgi:hypothetical protein